MKKETLIQLTSDLYKLTLLFPKKEPLRNKMRGLADEILADILRITNGYEYTNTKNNSFKTDLGVMEGFLAVAMAQNWVKPELVLRIAGRYDMLKQELEDAGNKIISSEAMNQKASGFDVVSHKNILRQDRILGILKEKGKAQVWELKQVFPSVSKRTLRRDFERLLSQGLVERIGEKNQTFYSFKAV